MDPNELLPEKATDEQVWLGEWFKQLDGRLKGIQVAAWLLFVTVLLRFLIFGR